MFALTPFVIAAGLLAPMLSAPAAGEECLHRSADDRVVARLQEAVRDYVAFGTTAPIFTPEAAELLRFQLRFTRWLHRHDPTETLSEPPTAARPVTKEAGAALLDALPRLPAQLEYRFHRRHLLLVDRRTRQVVDILEDAFGR